MRDQRISYASTSAQPCAIISRPASDSSATVALDSGQPCVTTAHEATATNRQPCATSAQAIARLRAQIVPGSNRNYKNAGSSRWPDQVRRGGGGEALEEKGAAHLDARPRTAATSAAHDAGCANQWRIIRPPSREQRSPAAGHHQHIARGTGPRGAASCTAQPHNAMRDQRISYASTSAQPCAIISRPASDSSATIALDSGQPCATTAREATTTNRQPCATSAQAIARLRARYCASMLAPPHIRALALIPLLGNNGVDCRRGKATAAAAARETRRRRRLLGEEGGGG
ncbi:hypothetical protein F511_18894 [Dorcoceras hygrometricum]|uniref:Uncharacterized protein n=1 Tax=Dorcoceras hygrometricum TaxID=472368 RepID=A0A2Z7AJN8_9LAMI|nr:hypothetical protein F511_18894 [Dorcoceras hygrometricum]